MHPYTLVAMASAEDDDRRNAPRLALLTVGCQATSDGIPRRSAIASGTARDAANRDDVKLASPDGCRTE